MVKVDLSPMIAKARAEGKYLWCHYQDLWFSPDELEKLNSEGRFLWGPVNWELRDPKERLEQLEAIAASTKGAAESFKSKLG